MDVLNTLCCMCGAQCGMEVHVQDNKILKIRGLKEDKNTRGKLCAKGLASLQLEYEANRLKYPMQRVGERGSGKWNRIKWEEALSLIKDKLEETVHQYGSKSVAWHRGTAPRWGSSWHILQRFMNVFGSPNLATHNHICDAPRAMSYYHTFGDRPFPDYKLAKCIIIWGSNPAATSLIGGMKKIFDAKDNGAKLIVIDPCFTKTASKADIFVQLRSGTDGALALGMLNVIINEDLYDREFVEKWTVGFNEMSDMVQEYTPEKVEAITGVSKHTIKEISRIYANTKPAIIQCGNGLDQHTNVVQTVRALAALMAITGNLGIPGGQIFNLPLGLKDISLKGMIENAYEKSVSSHPLYYNLPAPTLVSTPEITDSILNGEPYQIKALIVQASSIGTISSNRKRVMEALKKLDFLVVHELFMTATAEQADIVLPATTFLEQPSLIRRGGPDVESSFIGMMNKTVEPLGECWSDLKFIIELAKKLGYDKEFSWKNEEDAFNEELAPLGLTVEKIRENPGGVEIKLDNSMIYKRYEREGFGTPTGKVELYSKTFQEAGYDPLPVYKEPAESPHSRPDIYEEYPLVCNTGLKPGIFTHTRYRQLPWLKELMPEAFSLVHPMDADRVGVTDGDLINIESLRGSIQIRAKVTPSIKEGTVMVTHGWGQPYVGGPIANILTDDQERGPISGATGNRSFLCRITRGEDVQ